MAAPVVFQREWTVEINKMFNEMFFDDTAAILRVPAPLLERKPEAFIPQLLSLGPYHRSKLEKFIDSPCAELRISVAERYKVKSAVTLSWILRQSGKDFECIVEIMNRMRPEIESFYCLPSSTEGEYCKNFALMMAIDSSFLLQFLNYMLSFSISTLNLDPATDNFLAVYFLCIRHDILKLENQIPLPVLKEVLDYVKETIDDKSIPLLTNCCTLSPFPFDIRRDIPEKLIAEMEKEPHILGCIHTSLSQVLKMRSGDEMQVLEMPSGDETQKGRMGIVMHKFNGILNKPVTWIRRFLPSVPGFGIGGLCPAVPDPAVYLSQGMSARQLVTAGIKLKSFPKVPDYIRLDSGTLYLPEIRLAGMGAEIWLRNMLALEFNDALRPKYVTRYVALMGHLIQSPNDVRILVDGHVISPGLSYLTDERIFKMWQDLRQPFIVGIMTKVHKELYEALREWAKRSYWKNKIKRKVCGLYDFVLSWKFVAPVAAFSGLLMTALQTYCNFHHCSRER